MSLSVKSKLYATFQFFIFYFNSTPHFWLFGMEVLYVLKLASTIETKFARNHILLFLCKTNCQIKDTMWSKQPFVLNKLNWFIVYIFTSSFKIDLKIGCSDRCAALIWANSERPLTYSNVYAGCIFHFHMT